MVYEIILLIYLSEIHALNFYKEQFINIRFESGLVKLNQMPGTSTLCSLRLTLECVLLI